MRQMIKIRNLTKVYESNDNKQVAIDNISLNLPEKGLVAIFGASGCGKTTFLNLLGGLDKPTSGSIVIDDLDTSLFYNKDWDSYRNQKVAFVFQNYYLLPHLTVYENVALAMQMSKANPNIEEEVNRVLKEVNILHLKKRYPKSLSGGEMQRVAIARALVNHPSIVLADEPTGALDKENARLVMEILKEVSKNYLVLVVTHNEKLAEQYADRLLEISYGKIVSDSSPLEDESSNHGEKLQRVRIPLTQQMKWGARNLYKKKSRSIPIMAASAIGLAAVGIVLSMMVGISHYTKKAQEDSLGDYPVYISCYSNNSPQGHEETLEEYPDISEIIVEKPIQSEVAHVTMMQDDFLSYMDAMPASYYSFKDTASTIVFPILSKINDSYQHSDQSIHLS